MLFNRKPVTPHKNVRMIVEKSLDYTASPAMRDNSGDAEKLTSAFRAISVPAHFVKAVCGVRYQYYFTLDRPTDYQKMLSHKVLAVFEYIFGTSDVRLFADGSFLVLEVPGAENRSVRVGDILRCNDYTNSQSLKVAIGVSMNRAPVLINLEDAPHMLVAGETGSGKSIFLHQVICSLLINHSQDELRLYMIDTKRTELNRYATLRNVSVAFDPEKALALLKSLCDEMDYRYGLISRSGCRDISSYNAVSRRKLSRKVVFIDELSDLMHRGVKAVAEAYIVRLAQLARACGIHLVIATQRPDRTVVTGLIKDNIPTRVCMSVSSGINSRIILDRNGGERLTGKGDLLFLANGSREVIRCQAGNITEREIDNVISAVKWR